MLNDRCKGDGDELHILPVQMPSDITYPREQMHRPVAASHPARFCLYAFLHFVSGLHGAFRVGPASFKSETKKMEGHIFKRYFEMIIDLRVYGFLQGNKWFVLQNVFVFRHFLCL